MADSRRSHVRAGQGCAAVERLAQRPLRNAPVHPRWLPHSWPTRRPTHGRTKTVTQRGSQDISVPGKTAGSPPPMVRRWIHNRGVRPTQ